MVLNKPTIKDVAVVAKVSASTVSRAFSRPEAVAPAARERVLKAAKELGFTPNPLARSLALRRTGNVGLVVPDIANPYFIRLIKDMHRHTRSGGRNLFLADTDEQVQEEPILTQAMVHQVDGLILGSPRMSADQIRAVAAQVPTVSLGRRVDGVRSIGLPVGPQLAQAMALLVEHGHKKVGWLSGPSDSANTPLRNAAIREAAQARGVDLHEWGPLKIGEASGENAAADVLKSGVSAVVSYNDQIAFGLVTELRRRGVRVPEDLSVIGVDDSTIATLCNPPLTTVRVNLVTGGHIALDALQRVMDLPEDRVQALGTEHSVVVSDFIQRDSVAARSPQYAD